MKTLWARLENLSLCCPELLSSPVHNADLNKVKWKYSPWTLFSTDLGSSQTQLHSFKRRKDIANPQFPPPGLEVLCSFQKIRFLWALVVTTSWRIQTESFSIEFSRRSQAYVFYRQQNLTTNHKLLYLQLSVPQHIHTLTGRRKVFFLSITTRNHFKYFIILLVLQMHRVPCSLQ